MVREDKTRQLGYENRLCFLMGLVLTEVLRQQQPRGKKREMADQGKYLGTISEIMALLSEDLERSITLSELGGRYRLNPRYLNHIFKSITGYPVFQYQQQLRLEKVKRLLTASTLSVSEIALESGFNSVQTVDQVFKKHTGVSPGVFRRNGLV